MLRSTLCGLAGLAGLVLILGGNAHLETHLSNGFGLMAIGFVAIVAAVLFSIKPEDKSKW